MTDYAITYLNDAMETVETREVTAGDHWEACELGHAGYPEGATDFQVTEKQQAPLSDIDWLIENGLVEAVEAK
ncbi:hypothetical protein [Mesorhizobium sp. 1B3]|uniref:hypothetical protein n=1 Tax=Mesorhizobium sp. 1B3 TaxID=3243599 RepID=UPI003D980D6E